MLSIVNAFAVPESAEIADRILCRQKLPPPPYIPDPAGNILQTGTPNPRQSCWKMRTPYPGPFLDPSRTRLPVQNTDLASDIPESTFWISTEEVICRQCHAPNIFTRAPLNLYEGCEQKRLFGVSSCPKVPGSFHIKCASLNLKFRILGFAHRILRHQVLLFFRVIRM